ncbi:MAG: hypothetical protein AB1453_01865 [Chloroflexota bacterium]
MNASRLALSLPYPEPAEGCGRLPVIASEHQRAKQSPAGREIATPPESAAVRDDVSRHVVARLVRGKAISRRQGDRHTAGERGGSR